jgi:hypothetical protein
VVSQPKTPQSTFSPQWKPKIRVSYPAIYFISSFEIKKLKSYKSSGINQIPHKLIQA